MTTPRRISRFAKILVSGLLPGEKLPAYCMPPVPKGFSRVRCSIHEEADPRRVLAELEDEYVVPAEKSA